MEFSLKDSLRTAIELDSNGRNTVLYDDKGNPNIMYRFDKFDMKEFEQIGLTGTHPAFMVHGKEVPEIFISKYRNSTIGSVAVSLPGKPLHNDLYTECIKLCEAKGRGWHMMSSLEWGVIRMKMAEMKFEPDGGYIRRNGIIDIYGTPHSISGRDNRSTTIIQNENGVPLAGSHPVSWTHDGTACGIHDLTCGYGWEFVSGYITIDGKIYNPGFIGDTPWHQENNFDVPYTPGCKNWTKAVSPDGVNFAHGNYTNNEGGAGGTKKNDFESTLLAHAYHNYVNGLVMPNSKYGLYWCWAKGERTLAVSGMCQHNEIKEDIGCDGINSVNLDWEPDTQSWGFRSVYISPDYLPRK